MVQATANGQDFRPLDITPLNIRHQPNVGIDHIHTGRPGPHPSQPPLTIENTLQFIESSAPPLTEPNNYIEDPDGDYGLWQIELLTMPPISHYNFPSPPAGDELPSPTQYSDPRPSILLSESKRSIPASLQDLQNQCSLTTESMEELADELADSPMRPFLPSPLAFPRKTAVELPLAQPMYTPQSARSGGGPTDQAFGATATSPSITGGGIAELTASHQGSTSDYPAPPQPSDQAPTADARRNALRSDSPTNDSHQATLSTTGGHAATGQHDSSRLVDNLVSNDCGPNQHPGNISQPEATLFCVPPDQAQMPANLDQFFPHTDLEKPIVEDKEQKCQLSMENDRIFGIAEDGAGVPARSTSDNIDEHPPTTRWIKCKLIGSGSYGRVYLGLNEATGDFMAIKQAQLPHIEPGQSNRIRSAVKSLRKEISLLKDLYQAHIVSYLGCEESTEYISIFLEYVPGGSLASIYRNSRLGCFEEQLIKHFSVQILDGLRYLHENNIWHRGDNILVTADGICKIADFGISKRTASAYDFLSNATVGTGTVFWMAPEVFNAPKTRYNAKVDIWSLGCVVLEMWIGQPPWHPLEYWALVNKFAVVSDRSAPPLPKNVHLDEIAYDFLYNVCMVINPDDRPTALQLTSHPFITNRDHAWAFSTSPIGGVVKKLVDENLRSAKQFSP
ncbi:hypothetical protein CspHIS471_0201770 [Cutaneotrichosporon sp. HIS471]|nr:hypothetical protein CspHIS471_0201770 [Cutaneotrichosporon sp. HIS471]